MAAKKKKATAASVSRLPAGTVSLPASEAEDRAPSAQNEHSSVNPQQIENPQESWPLYGPVIEYESCDENCAGWGKIDKKSSEDKERAEIARKAKLKKEKSQVPAVAVAARRDTNPTALSQKVGFSRALVKLAKTCVNTESMESALHASCHTPEQFVSESVPEDIKVIKSITSVGNTCIMCTSLSSETVASNTVVTKSTVAELDSSIKLIEKLARQERDLKSAKTQAGSLRAEIEVLNQKHRLEIQKQLDQLNESHRKEMDAIKLNLEEVEATRQKASTDLRKVREKN
ncbi:hypothetical protein ACHAO1_005795 [Botrytis cinerea]